MLCLLTAERYAPSTLKGAAPMLPRYFQYLMGYAISLLVCHSTLPPNPANGWLSQGPRTLSWFSLCLQTCPGGEATRPLMNTQFSILRPLKPSICYKASTGKHHNWTSIICEPILYIVSENSLILAFDWALLHFPNKKLRLKRLAEFPKLQTQSV